MRVPAGLVVALGICWLGLSSCEPLFTCHKEILEHFPSPEGTYEALLVKTSCGATTRDMFWVTLRRPDRRDVDHLVAVAQKAPIARWSSPRTLHLTPTATH